jgi:nitrile hydratase accessory protein
MKKAAMPLDQWPALSRDKDGPVFAEPWEAQAFALAVHLSAAGHFTWSEWAAVLSEEIRVAQDRGDPDLGLSYYRHWLNALERICIEKGLASREAMRRRAEAWRRAYLHTPHGQPVDLSAGTA